MRISKQSSGGRGEYEIAETAPNGLTPQDLFDKDLHLKLGDSVINTRVHLSNSQGKRRLRLSPPANHPHVHTQVANALMMPAPIRDELEVLGGQPVLQHKGYILKHINFGEVQLHANYVLAEVISVDSANRSVEADRISLPERTNMVTKIWRNSRNFPPSIGDLIRSHEDQVKAGGPLNKGLTDLNTELRGMIQAYSAEIGIAYSDSTDVVPAMLSIIGNVETDMPLPLDQIEPERLEIRKREVKKWQQYVARRGAASAKFREDIRKAYNSTCVMCGARFPATSVNSNPGVDAAHILPWADYDLDKVYNGLALCKLHHWAFDEGLLLVTHRAGEYFIELNAEAEDTLLSSGSSIDVLKKVVGKIPISRLPLDQRDRPHPDLLQQFCDEIEQ